jgi:hypothetical protein
MSEAERSTRASACRSSTVCDARLPARKVARCCSSTVWAPTWRCGIRFGDRSVPSHDCVRCTGNRRILDSEPATHDASWAQSRLECSARWVTTPSTCSATRSEARSRRRWLGSIPDVSTDSCWPPPAAVGAPFRVIRSPLAHAHAGPLLLPPGDGGGERCSAGAGSVTSRRPMPPARTVHRTRWVTGGSCFAASGWSSLPWLHRLRVPTLVLATARPARACEPRTLAHRIPDARLAVVRNANHFFLLREDTRASRLVTTFLDEARVGRISLRPSWPVRSFDRPRAAPASGRPSTASRRIALSVDTASSCSSPSGSRTPACARSLGREIERPADRLQRTVDGQFVQPSFELAEVRFDTCARSAI